MSVMLLVSCTVIAPLRSKISAASKQITNRVAASKPRSETAASSPRSPQFLQPMSVEAEKPASVSAIKYNTGHQSGKTSSPVFSAGVAIQPNELSYETPYIEAAGSLQLKYAILLDTLLEHLPDPQLLKQVDEWMGVRYRSGGESKKGIDCSGFTSVIFADYCGTQLPRTSKQQFEFCQKIEVEELRAGDLLFFSTRGRGVSHVGIYLGNDKFIHASVSSGVIISDRKEHYYSKRFIGAGRIPAAIITP